MTIFQKLWRRKRNARHNKHVTHTNLWAKTRSDKKVVDLQGVREAAGLSRDDLGARMGLSLAQIGRYEAEPGSATINLASEWCGACGANLEGNSDGFPPNNHAGLRVGEPYRDLHRKLSLLEQYTEIGPRVPSSLPPIAISPEDFQLKVKQWKRKPSVLIAGRFDSGKTRIANALLGSNHLPSQYTPTTSVATFIRHKEDRPAWQRNDVWVMGKDFEPSTWQDEKACQRHKLIAGTFDTLRQFGTKDSHGETLGAKFALVYMDAPILRGCTLIDVPGYSDDYEEERLANTSATTADILIYTAPANGFMDAADLLHLGLLLRSLPVVHARSSKSVEKFSNLFLVATHAVPSISDEQLERIISVGSRRLYKHLKDSVFKTRNVSEEDLQLRFNTFWDENPKRRSGLERGVRYTLSEVMPVRIEKQVDLELGDIKSKATGAFAAQIAAYQKTLSTLAEAQKRIEELRKQAPEHRKRVRDKKKEIKAKIELLRVESLAFVRNEIRQMLAPSAIEAFIRQQFPNENEAKNDAIAKLLEDVQFQLDNFLKAKASQLTPIVDGFVKEYEITLEAVKSAEYGDFCAIPFDAQGAFVGGLAGLGTLGVLGFWASAMGNLGGYILVAKLASVLSVLGLGVGSSSLVTFVAALGGPAIVAIGIVSILVSGFWALFGPSWQRRLAEKISELLTDKELLKKVEQLVNSRWDDTWRAFDAGAIEVEKKFEQYLHANEQLLAEGDECSKVKIESTIKSLDELRGFFAEIPWASPV